MDNSHGYVGCHADNHENGLSAPKMAPDDDRRITEFDCPYLGTYVAS